MLYVTSLILDIPEVYMKFNFVNQIQESLN